MEILDELRQAFEAKRNPERAAKQSAYLKGHFPFFGIEKPIQKSISKEIFRRFSLDNWVGAVEQLWQFPEREFHYAALDLAIHYQKKWREEHLGLFESLVRRHSWWDTVDGIAAHLVGKLILKHPHLAKIGDDWIRDADFWIRRTAILFQLTWKNKTEAERLFQYCLSQAGEKEFFIRKGIGWALREYGKSAPERVGAFLLEHGSKLQPLSLREAKRRLQNFLYIR